MSTPNFLTEEEKRRVRQRLKRRRDQMIRGEIGGYSVERSEQGHVFVKVYPKVIAEKAS